MTSLLTKFGFTLIELLLAMGIIVILGAMSLPIQQNFQTRNDLHMVSIVTAQSLRRAQMLSRAVDGDTTWGVHITSGTITLFQGASYAARDTSFDELFDTSSGITASGVGEVVFTKLTGDPQTTGSITFTSPSSESITLTLNSEGMVNY